MSNDRTVIAIPAYNCAQQLPRVLADIDERVRAMVDQIWVVDNGSSDDTVGRAEAFRRERADGMVRIFRNDENVNLGGTHKAVFAHAQTEGLGRVVILHGDDQARGGEKSLTCWEESDRRGGATVLGSRFMRGSRLRGYDLKRILGNRALNVIYSCVAFRRLSDLGSGLNVFRLSDIDQQRSLRFGDSLSFNYELLLDLVRRRVPFTYVPITWSETDQVSNARNVRIFTAALRILARWRLGQETTPQTTSPTPAYTWKEVAS